MEEDSEGKWQLRYICTKCRQHWPTEELVNKCFKYGPNRKFELSLIEKQRIATKIDGEGSISLATSRHKSGKVYLYPILEIANTNERFLKEFELLGLKIYPRSQRQKNQKKSFEARTGNTFLIRLLLQQLEPFFEIKKKQADLVIEFADSRMEHYFKPNTNDEFRIYNKMKKINKRGT